MTLPTPERWAEIERLLDGALELAPEERAEWLGRMCCGRPRAASRSRAAARGLRGRRLLPGGTRAGGGGGPWWPASTWVRRSSQATESVPTRSSGSSAAAAWPRSTSPRTSSTTGRWRSRFSTPRSPPPGPRALPPRDPHHRPAAASPHPLGLRLRRRRWAASTTPCPMSGRVAP